MTNAACRVCGHAHYATEPHRPFDPAMAGLDLFAPASGVSQAAAAYARHTDPDTSHEAADAQTAEKIRLSQAVILELLRTHGRMTDPEIWDQLEAMEFAISPSGARTRRKELVDLGLVESDGKTDEPDGRRHRYWKAVEG
jgi:predicted HTH transcriptional regulator